MDTKTLVQEKYGAAARQVRDTSTAACCNPSFTCCDPITTNLYEESEKCGLPANAVRLYHSNDQISDWLKCMQTRKLPICDVEIGQRTATICNLVNQVYFNRKGCKWNPKAEQFTDGTGGASWLTREYRAPWTLA